MTKPIGRRAFLPSLFLLSLYGLGPLNFPALLPSVYANEPKSEDDDAAQDKAQSDADAQVRNAKTPFEKLNAYYKRSFLPDSMRIVTDADWKTALSDIDAAISSLQEIEKEGLKIEEKADLYFRRGYILSSFSESLVDHLAVIAAYNRAEAAGYAALSADREDKGASLWNNRAEAKASLHDYAGALLDFDIAVVHDPDWMFLRNRADTKFQLGDYEGAVADWKSAKAKRPSLPDVPYDPAEVPLNKAIIAAPNAAAPLIARSRFFVKKAKSAPMNVTRKKNEDEDDDEDDPIYFVSFSLADLPTPPKPKVYSKLQLINSALADLDRAVKVEPALASAWLERGRVRNIFLSVEAWKNKRAFPADGPLNDFKQAIKTDDKTAGAWVELGRFQLKEIEADDLPLMNETEAQWNAKRQLKIGEAIANLSRAICLRPTSSGEAHFLRAFGERNRSTVDYHAVTVDYTAAIDQKLSLVDDDPNAEASTSARFAEAHGVLAQIAMIEGRLDSAVAEFGQQIRLDPNNLNPRINRGKVALQQGEYDTAITDFDFVIKGNPKAAEAWWWRGVAHDGKDKVELARTDLAQAIKLDPSLVKNMDGSRYAALNPQPTVRLAPTPVHGDLPPEIKGTALEHKDAGNGLRGKNDLEGALAEYNKAIRLDPSFADAYNNRGGVYNVRGESDLALADFTRAIELDPRHRAAYFNRGLLWRTLGDRAGERSDLDRAFQYADSDARRGAVLAERALTRYSTQDKAGAVADAKQGTLLAPQDAATWKALGQIQIMSAQYPDAVKSFRRVVELEPDVNAGHINLAIAMAHVGDVAAEAELKKGLVGTSVDEIATIANIINNAIKNDPGSTVLLKLKTQIEKPVHP